MSRLQFIRQCFESITIQDEAMTMSYTRNIREMLQEVRIKASFVEGAMGLGMGGGRGRQTERVSKPNRVDEDRRTKDYQRKSLHKINSKSISELSLLKRTSLQPTSVRFKLSDLIRDRSHSRVPLPSIKTSEKFPQTMKAKSMKKLPFHQAKSSLDDQNVLLQNELILESTLQKDLNSSKILDYHITK